MQNEKIHSLTGYTTSDLEMILLGMEGMGESGDLEWDAQFYTIVDDLKLQLGY